jgi:glycosyltransferase involved in cell wall biosynthesis
MVCRNQDAFLSDRLASVAAQTYPRLEVLILADGSTDGEALKILEMMKSRHRGFRFLDQDSASSVLKSDRGLWEAHGDYFIPLAADTFACPDMVERFVAALRRNPDLSAMTCYVLALREAVPPIVPESRLLASTKNLYSSGIFRTAHLRKIGGYGTDLETPDWIGFLGLVNAGYRVDILPEHLFYYRLAGCERVLAPFFEADRLLAAERVALWTAFSSMQRHLERLAGQNRALRAQSEALQNRLGFLRYRVADRLTLLCSWIPFAKRVIHWICRELDVTPRVSSE